MEKREFLKDGERLDDLERDGLYIIQKKGGYCFTSDAVLLSDFVKANAKERAAELGAGSGVISVLVAAKTKAREIVAMEIQPRLYDSAKRSVEMNGLSDRIKVVETDIKRAAETFGSGSFDVVFTNPPYYAANGETDERSAARREVFATLEDFIKAAADILKFGGRFYIVNKTERLSETFCLMSKYGIEPKVLRLIVPKTGGSPDAFLAEGRKGGNRGLKVLPCLTVYDGSGEPSEEIKGVYGK